MPGFSKAIFKTNRVLEIALLSGILAVMLIFSFTVLGCGNEDENGIDDDSELDDGDSETDENNGPASGLQTIKITAAVVLQFNMDEKIYFPYEGSVTEITSEGGNVSGSITNGILNLTIDAPLEEHYLYFQNHEMYSMFSVEPPELEYFTMLPFGIHELFSVTEAATERKLMLGRFRDDAIGHGAHMLIYSKGDGIISITTDNDTDENSNVIVTNINVKNGWNYFEVNAGNLIQNIEKPGDNYKWYIWEFSDNSGD